VEQGFHEAITESLSENVQHISTWTDLPLFEKSGNVSYEFSNDSMIIHDLAADVLEEASQVKAGTLYVIGLAVKFRPGTQKHIDIIQLRTKSRVIVLKVCD